MMTTTTTNSNFSALGLDKDMEFSQEPQAHILHHEDDDNDDDDDDYSNNKNNNKKFKFISFGTCIIKCDTWLES